MKISHILIILFGSLFITQACIEKELKNTKVNNHPFLEEKPVATYSQYEFNSRKGFQDNGQIISEFNCPDDLNFPPIDLKLWDKVPVVNGRLPKYEETKNGTAISHYGEVENREVRIYPITLPKLAYFRNPTTKKNEIVVVIQVVQTPKDTVVGFRYITGGCGGSLFRDFRFLTDDEVLREVK